MFLSLLLGALAIMASCSPSQQVDTAYRPPIPNPTHELGRGPVIWIDQAHNNIVTAEPSSRYTPFVAALRADGYVVRRLRSSFTPPTLNSVRVLVIGNALHSRNVNDWSLPTPSAFTADEIRAVHRWVFEGGRLLLLC